MKAALLVTALSATLFAQNPQLTAPRPIDAGQSLWSEELTWMEVRDLVKAGALIVAEIERLDRAVIAGKDATDEE